jgi:hypothetical protein
MSPIERRRNRPLETPTFAQTVVIIQTMGEYQDCEAIIQRHLALGFHYDKDQIYRALDALTRDPQSAASKRRSGQWT